MPRGSKPAPRKKPTISSQIQAFSFRVEEATPGWLDEHERRAKVLTDRFNETDDDGNYVASVSEQAQIHKILSLSHGQMMRFAAVREQVQKEKGVSHFQEKQGDTHNHLTLNFPPDATPEQRRLLESIYLSSLNGRPIEVLPAPVPAEVKDTPETTP